MPDSFDRLLVPRHVFMTADTVGGVWNYALEMCAALACHKIHVSVATMGPAPTPRQRAELRHLRNVDLYESTFRLEWMDGAEQDFDKAGDWLLSLARRIEPDVIHLNGYSHAALRWNAPVIVVAHSCLLSWWAAVKRQPPPVEWEDYRRRVSAGLSAANLVIAPTRAMLAQIEDIYGHLERTAVIPNGRDSYDFPRGIKQDLIFSAGRLWDEAKNFAILNSVAPRLSWPLYVAGDNRNPNGSRIELPGAIFLGQLAPPELVPWFSRAAIYASPVRYEPFGLSVLEAALAGCALVLGDIPSLRENWNGVALFVSPDDPEGLKSAIQGLIDNPQIRSKLARSSVARASRFTPAAMAHNYVHAYESVLQSYAGALPETGSTLAQCV